MKLIVGLGNPGARYRWTRHNIGFLVVGELAKSSFHKAQASGEATEGSPRGTSDSRSHKTEVILALPQTYVNRSGAAVQPLVKRHRIALGDLLVVCDDVQLPMGRLRLRAKGSAGGHHGLESVIEALQNDQFCRLRIGVGQEEMPKDLAAFVLAPIRAQDRRRWQTLMAAAAQACETWATEGIQAAMNRWNACQL